MKLQLDRLLAGAAALAALCAWGEDRPNVLNMATGAVVLERAEYDEATWSAFNLFDDNPASMWCSPEGKPLGNAVVMELPQRHQLTSLVLDTTQVQESKYPGVSARNVELWVSTTGPAAGYRKAATFEAPRAGRKEFALAPGTSAEWLKLVVVDNWGSKQYTEMTEVAMYGTPEGTATKRASVSGIYKTNYGPLQLVQEGESVTGCWDKGDGQVSGSTDGRVVSLQWRRGNGNHGAAIMVLTTAGDLLNGLWYQSGTLRGTWSGKRDAKLPQECPRKGGIEADLQQGGRAIAYGIRFKTNSDQIEAESEPVLRKIVAVLGSNPKMKLRIEGHTDSTNTDAYNMDLSKRRAASVVRWLTAHGVQSTRLASEGFGRARPVADNATPQGRALNRRVELVAEKS